MMSSLCRLARYFGSIKQFKLPDLGEKIKEATVVKWHVKEGDHVNEFDAVADVSTDKMFTQIPSTYTGTIHKRFHKEEAVCQVGELFLEIDVNEDSTQQPKQQKSDSASKKAQQASASPQQAVAKSQDPSCRALTPTSLVRCSPAARHLAQNLNIDLDLVKGTGIYGTITKEDVLNQSLPKSSPPKPKASNAPQPSQTIKMSDFQKGMQKSMTESNKIPHLYLQEEVDVTSLSSLRETLKQQQNVTFMTLFIKSFSIALSKHAILNSTYDLATPFSFTTHESHNISIALDSPKGLVVPNIKQVQALSISEIQQKLNQLRKLGEEGKLGPKELTGGTICLSNIGTIAGTYLGPLILPPQVCIVGIGRVILQPKWVNGAYQPRKIMYTSFGCDHRVLDGATVTKFSNEWKALMEAPELMVLNLK